MNILPFLFSSFFQKLFCFAFQLEARPLPLRHGGVTLASNSSTQKVRQENCMFCDSLGYINKTLP
jgi:hypothetical protein